MHALGVFYFADNRTRVHVEHFDLSSVRNIQAAGAFINREIVPAALTGYGDFLRDLIVVNGPDRRDREGEQDREGVSFQSRTSLCEFNGRALSLAESLT